MRTLASKYQISTVFSGWQCFQRGGKQDDTCGDPHGHGLQHFTGVMWAFQMAQLLVAYLFDMPMRTSASKDQMSTVFSGWRCFQRGGKQDDTCV